MQSRVLVNDFFRQENVHFFTKTAVQERSHESALKICCQKNLLQNSQENTSAGDCFLINPSGLLRKKTLLQSNSGTDVFFWIFPN